MARTPDAHLLSWLTSWPVSNRLRTVSLRTNRACFLLAGLVLAAALPSSAGQRGRFPSLHFGRAQQTVVAGHLDNDHRLDLAVATPAQLGSSSYTVQISLAATAAVTSFDLTAHPGGLSLAPRDVDGDDDLDLVITTFFGERVGIWLNDGMGRFARSVSFRYPEWIWHDPPQFSAAQPKPAGPDFTAGSGNSLLTAPGQAAGCEQASVEFRCPLPNPHPLAGLRGQNRIRPPPAV